MFDLLRVREFTDVAIPRMCAHGVHSTCNHRAVSRSFDGTIDGLGWSGFRRRLNTGEYVPGLFWTF